MKALVLATGLLFLAGAAHATCANSTASVSPVIGGSPVHVTIVNSATCAQIGPTGVTISPPAASLATVVADATGFNITAVGAGGGSVIFGFPGATGVTLSISIASPVTLGVTSP